MEQRELDVAAVIDAPRDQWTLIADQRAWGKERRRSVHSIALHRLEMWENDAKELASLPADTDKAAWATEQSWDDERIQRAMTKLQTQTTTTYPIPSSSSQSANGDSSGG